MHEYCTDTSRLNAAKPHLQLCSNKFGGQLIYKWSLSNSIITHFFLRLWMGKTILPIHPVFFTMCGHNGLSKYFLKFGIVIAFFISFSNVKASTSYFCKMAYFKLPLSKNTITEPYEILLSSCRNETTQSFLVLAFWYRIQ